MRSDPVYWQIINVEKILLITVKISKLNFEKAF